MATAYAAITSLMNLMTQLNEHPNPPIQLDEELVDSLKSKISFFQRFLEDHHTTVDRGLEMRIADAAHAAEDLIETHITDQIHGQVDLYLKLESVTEEGVDSIENSDAGIKEITSKIRNKLAQKRKSSHLKTSVSSGYADHTSAMNIIEQHPSYIFHKRQADSLGSKIHFVDGFLKPGNAVDHGLDMGTVYAARNAEESVETQIGDLIRGQEDFHRCLQIALEGLSSVENQVMKVQHNEQSQGHKKPGGRRHDMPLASSQSPSDEKNIVGIEDATNEIKGMLTRQGESGRRLISITGMGGIGKTTLARKVYDDPYIDKTFDKRAWASVSRDYNTKDIIIDLILCLDRQTGKESLSQENEHKLGEKLSKDLFSKRYLIVLDDVWNLEVWERLRFFFPERSDSRIVITTRELHIAGSRSVGVDLLDEVKSWDLFCKNVFGQGRSCPVEFEGVGKNIANRCKGLPLSIVVIGGHLAKSPSTLEYWKEIEENLNSVVNSVDERCHRIMSLSYTHMPVHLKPCFLYTAIFPEDKVIRVSRLVRLWVSEGFLRPINKKSLEEVAESYLYDLIARNLVFDSESSTRGRRAKGIKMHDLLRDLCVKEALEKNFLGIRQNPGEQRALKDGLRIVVQPRLSKGESPYDVVDDIKSQDKLRTLVTDEVLPLLENKLARVIAPATQLKDSRRRPPQFHVQNWSVNWRYIECVETIWDVYINRAIFHPWNLQYLLIPPIFANPQPNIWEMPQLRRIKINYLILDRPPSGSSSSSSFIMNNLETAKTIINFSFCKEVVERIPKIKKLAVRYVEGLKGFDEAAYTLNNVYRLGNLESFRCFLDLKNVKPSHMLQKLTLPHSLKKLNFRSLHFDDLSGKISLLPLLEVLKLCDCEGTEWNLDGEKFEQLKFLQLYDCCSLEELTVDNDHFRILESLVLVNLDGLKTISLDIRDTIKLMEFKFCPDEAVICAKEIADDAKENEIEGLKVNVFLLKESQLSESLHSTDNFHVETYESYGA